MRPRRAVVALFVIVFSVAAIYLLYDGVTTGNYLLVVLVLVAYAFVVMLEMSLAMRPRKPTKRPPGAKTARSSFAPGCKPEVERLSMNSVPC